MQSAQQFVQNHSNFATAVQSFLNGSEVAELLLSGATKRFFLKELVSLSEETGVSMHRVLRSEVDPKKVRTFTFSFQGSLTSLDDAVLSLKTALKTMAQQIFGFGDGIRCVQLVDALDIALNPVVPEGIWCQSVVYVR